MIQTKNPSTSCLKHKTITISNKRENDDWEGDNSCSFYTEENEKSHEKSDNSHSNINLEDGRKSINMKIDGEENKVIDLNEDKDSQKIKSFENLQVDENHLEHPQMNNESEFKTEDIPHEDELNSAESSEQIKQHNEDGNSAHNDLINSNDRYEHQDGDEKANSLNQSQSEVHIEYKGDNSNDDNDSLFKHDLEFNANQNLPVKENNQNECTTKYKFVYD